MAVADETAYRLRRLLVERRLGPDDKLPSERELTDILGVSRTSVRAALMELEATGLVSISARRGAFVTRDDVGGIAMSLRGWFESNNLPLHHLVEFRRALEPAAAATAARHRTAADIAQMSAMLDRMRAATRAEDPIDFAAADTAFHEHIAVASQNPLFSVMLRSLAEPLRAFREGAARLGSPILVRSLGDHLRIYEAIQAQAADAAAAAMLSHIVETNVDFHIVAREELE